MGLANLLTLSRIFLVPVFLIAVIYDRMLSALVLFSLAGLTDFFDGFFARRFRQETVLGSFLDPISDKLLMTVSFLALAIKGLLPAWLAVVVVSKDLFVSLGVAILYFSGSQVAAVPTLWGKQTTFLQMVTVGVALLLAALGLESGFWGLLFVLAGLVTIFTGLHYIVEGLRSFPSSPQGPA